MRRALAALATALAVGALVPAAAEAHGLVQRQQLPIPQWLFAWAAAAVLVISFFALAVLWPTPRLEQRQLAPAAGRQGARRACPLQILCGAIGVALLVVTILAGYLGSGHGAGQLGADVPADHVLGRDGVRLDPVRRRLPRASARSARSGRLLPSLNRPYPGAARALAGGGRAAHLHLDRAGLRVGRGPGDARHRGARLHGADAGRAGLLGRRDAGRATARRSRSTSTCSPACRSSRCATACSACGGRSAGCRGSTRRRARWRS